MTEPLLLPGGGDPGRLQPLPAAPAAGPGSREQDPGGLVLIVEDERELAEILEYNLQACGFTTLWAEDGLSACRLAGTRKPDLILLDILLPDLDGWEICRLIRSHHMEELATIPIVMLTALSAAGDRLRGLELGADAYIPKPYSLREVTLTVRNLVARRRRQQAMAREVERMQQQESVRAEIQTMLFHELRNQVTVLTGYAGLLGRSLAEPREDQQPGPFLEVIQRSSSYLTTLAEEFYLLGRMEATRLELPVRETDPAALAGETVELCRGLAREKGIALELEAAPAGGDVLVNGTAAKLVLVNLIENAIRYSSPGTRVRVRLAGPREGKRRLEVLDQGPGIPPEELPRIFDKFYRAEGSAGRNRQGSGLGLYFVRVLAAAMGVGIDVASRPGSGSSFRVDLPLAARAPAT